MKKRAIATTKRLIKFTTSSKLAFALGLEIIIGVVICLVTLFLFLKIADGVFEKEILKFDRVGLEFFLNLRSPNLSKIMIDITNLGSGTILFLISAVIIGFVYFKRKRDAYIFTAILYSGAIVNYLLKFLFHRSRPDLSPVIIENTYSFPSGHAMNSFVFYFAITYFIFRTTSNTKLTILAALISATLIALIGISRVYLGVHYPSDVLAGYIAGFFWLTSAIVFDKAVIFERLYTRAKVK